MKWMVRERGISQKKICNQDKIKIQTILPDLKEISLADNALLYHPEKVNNNEVYAGLPTVSNSIKILKELKESVSVFSFEINDLPNMIRPLLTRIELVGVLASSINLFELEYEVWDRMFKISSQSGRFLDASYALVNSCLSKLFSFEQETVNEKFLLSSCCKLQGILNDNSKVLEASHEACLSGRLPTHHAHLQSVFVFLGRAYIESYMNWSKFCANMDLIPVRHTEFFAGKSWAAVCARGYFYWFYLHARCVFGPKESCHLMTSDSSDANPTFPHPPKSLLHSAVLVRLHGQTLVQYMRQYCEQKCRTHGSSSVAQCQSGYKGKENENPFGHQSTVASTQTTKESLNNDSSNKMYAWTSSHLNDSEMLNLWLGTRLLFYGCQKITELYTLFGTVREARAYQNELLRVGQRFHLCSYAQNALTLMAYLDMFAQRQWSFELRLRQLHHIATCQVKLEDMVNMIGRLKTNTLDKQTNAHTEDEDESNFIHTVTFPTSLNPAAVDSDGLSKHDDLISDGCNPLLLAYNKPFSSMFETSPTKQSRNDVDKYDGVPLFPNPIQIASVIDGSRLFADEWRLWFESTESFLSKQDDRVSSRFVSVGAASLGSCVVRILNGAPWPWLHQLVGLVRMEVLPVKHYFPALVFDSKSLAALSQTCNKIEDDDDTNALIEAFSMLETSKSDTKDASNNRIVENLHKKNKESQLVDAKKKPTITVPNAPKRVTNVFPCSDNENVSISTRSRTSRRAASERFINAHTNLNSSGAEPDKIVRQSRSRRKKNDCKAGDDGSNLDYSDGSDTELILKQLGYVAPSKPARTKRLQIYMDKENDCEYQLTNAVKSSRKTTTSQALTDPAESCSSLTDAFFRPKNVRLMSQWARNQMHHHGCQSTDQTSSTPTLDHLVQSNKNLLPQIQMAYVRLGNFPIPNLLRPICHWLGLYWLGQNDHHQAGRYFGQAVGIGVTSLYLSILCSKMTQLKSLSDSNANSSSFDLLHSDQWAQIFESVEQVCVPNNSLGGSQNIVRHDDEHVTINVVQLNVIDELDSIQMCNDQSDGHDRILQRFSDNSIAVPYGMGARTGAHLVLTRYRLTVGTRANFQIGLKSESRVIYNFTVNGIEYLNKFDELQTESLDSLRIEDRVNYWRTRFNLDERLDSLIGQLRQTWFTTDDLDWIWCRGKYKSEENNSNSNLLKSTIIIPDRRLVYLPWEWILWKYEPAKPVPNFTRNFSLALVVGQLMTQCYLLKYSPKAQRSVSNPNVTTNGRSLLSNRTINPKSAYYILNPEANLPFTQETFELLFRKFSSWKGVVGRLPNAKEVNDGFTKHDLFIYLGHGNGSQFLLQTFNQGLLARSVALILGCSSGKPRWEGRHEPYTSLFNHVIAGCPFVAGLLWDVTDRDLDRYTKEFLIRWLCKNNHSPSSLSFSIFHSSSACKLKHLVGKSVIVYGIPVEPNLHHLLTM